MKLATCTVCCDSKTAIQCDVCGSASCKHCSYFIDESIFEHQSLLPEHLRGKGFCPNCYNESIGAELTEYQELMARAKAVNVYSKVQGTETRRIRRIEKPIQVKECSGREEALIKLAFLAAQKGYDTIVDVDLTWQKIGTKSYIRLVWNGTAVPVTPRPRKSTQ